MISTQRHRTFLLSVTRAGAALSAAMLIVTVGLALGGNVPASAAAVNGGALTVLVPPGSSSAGQPLSGGGSATKFALSLPSGAACAGDSATDGYRVQSYMVPAAVGPESLTYDSGGPTPQDTGTAFRQPLFGPGGPMINETTVIDTGQLQNIPAFSFDIFGSDGPTILPQGVYNVGLACTLGQPSVTQLDRYWNVQLRITHDTSDQPAGLVWAVEQADTTTTTTSPTTTTSSVPGNGSTTTTTSTTTTSVAGTTTTTSTVAGGTTATTVATGGGTATSAGGGTSSGGGTLVATGSSTTPLIVWGVLLLVFGRMAILLGKKPKVIYGGPE